MKTKSIISIILLFTVMLSLSACNTIAGGTKIQFSFSQIIAASFYGDQKAIYINEDMDMLELQAALKINAEDLAIQVINTSNNEIVWAESYAEDADFTIELVDLKADTQYLLKIEATQAKKVNLTLSCMESLVKDKEKPEKYNVEGKASLRES